MQNYAGTLYFYSRNSDLFNCATYVELLNICISSLREEKKNNILHIKFYGVIGFSQSKDKK